MGKPSISKREWFREVPGEPNEPTSTIVLTSKDDYFVDIRILLEPYALQKDRAENTIDCLEWAFAGKSSTSNHTRHKETAQKTWHSKWEHWIDSQTDQPEPDAGQMTEHADGRVLEEGVDVDPHTGKEQKYAELWQDLPIDRLGKKGNRSSIVARAENADGSSKGLMIKVGGWCQAILKSKGGLTAERWQWLSSNTNQGEENEQNQIDERPRTRNDWVRTFRLGRERLPCEYIVEASSGKIGLKAVFKDDAGLEWKLIEEHYFDGNSQ